MEDRMLASDLVPDVAGSEALLDKHQEYKVIIMSMAMSY